MHTVKFAKEQGKKVLVADLPASGNQKLIEEGYEVLKL
jgi:predicted Rossmann fold nucleotide-binding protein DprA/Smf involved in DNA uptake